MVLGWLVYMTWTGTITIRLPNDAAGWLWAVAVLLVAAPLALSLLAFLRGISSGRFGWPLAASVVAAVVLGLAMIGLFLDAVLFLAPVSPSGYVRAAAISLIVLWAGLVQIMTGWISRLAPERAGRRIVFVVFFLSAADLAGAVGLMLFRANAPTGTGFLADFAGAIAVSLLTGHAVFFGCFGLLWAVGVCVALRVAARRAGRSRGSSAGTGLSDQS